MKLAVLDITTANFHQQKRKRLGLHHEMSKVQQGDVLVSTVKAKSAKMFGFIVDSEPPSQRWLRHLALVCFAFRL